MTARGEPVVSGSPWKWSFLGAGTCALLMSTTTLLPSDRACRIATGVAALLILIASAAYGARKWLLVSRLGSLHAWMAGHVGLGAALLVAVLWHADLAQLGAPGCALVALVGVEAASGLWALIELSVAPRRFGPVSLDDVCFPTTARRRLALLCEDVGHLLDRHRPALRTWFDERYRAVLEGRAAEPPPLEGFAPEDARVAADLHARVAQMARLRTALARALPAERAGVRWSWVHVPVSLALVTMVVLHVIGWLVYG